MDDDEGYQDYLMEIIEHECSHCSDCGLADDCHE
jgi:hypothetical protein